MKYRTTMILPIALALGACATDGRPSTASELAMASAGCSEGKLKFHAGDSNLWVTPKNKCMNQGMTYYAEIKEHGITLAEGDVNISGSPAWLNKSNTPNRLMIEITVPEAATLGDHKYELIVDDVGRLDPVVRVRTKGAE